MKFTILMCFCVLTTNAASLISNNKPFAANTLSQDLDENTLFGALRCLLHDEQFQTFVRLINSNERLHSHAEVTAFNTWLRQTIMLSAGQPPLDGSEEYLSTLNRSPFWAYAVSDWQNIINEFLLYYPEDHIQLKIAQNGVFAQFFQGLQTVYDNIIALPAAQRLAAALEAKGINTTAIDTFIRNQFGWLGRRAAVEEQNFTAGPTDLAESTQQVPVSTTHTDSQY